MSPKSVQVAERLKADDADLLAFPVALVIEIERRGVGQPHLVAELHERAQLSPRRTFEPQSDRLPQRHAVIMPGPSDSSGVL